MLKDLNEFFKTEEELANTLIIDDSQKAWCEKDQPRIIYSKKFAPFYKHDSLLVKAENTPNSICCMTIDSFLLFDDKLGYHADVGKKGTFK